MPSHIAKAIGNQLGEAHAAIEALLATPTPEQLKRPGLRLCQRFRSDARAGAEGWGAKGELGIEPILRVRRRAADQGQARGQER